MQAHRRELESGVCKETVLEVGLGGGGVLTGIATSAGPCMNDLTVPSMRWSIDFSRLLRMLNAPLSSTGERCPAPCTSAAATRHAHMSTATTPTCPGWSVSWGAGRAGSGHLQNGTLRSCFELPVSIAGSTALYAGLSSAQQPREPEAQAVPSGADNSPQGPGTWPIQDQPQKAATESTQPANPPKTPENFTARRHVKEESYPNPTPTLSPEKQTHTCIRRAPLAVCSRAAIPGNNPPASADTMRSPPPQNACSEIGRLSR